MATTQPGGHICFAVDTSSSMGRQGRAPYGARAALPRINHAIRALWSSLQMIQSANLALCVKVTSFDATLAGEEENNGTPWTEFTEDVCAKYATPSFELGKGTALFDTIIELVESWPTEGQSPTSINSLQIINDGADSHSRPESTVEEVARVIEEKGIPNFEVVIHLVDAPLGDRLRQLVTALPNIFKVNRIYSEDTEKSVTTSTVAFTERLRQ